MKILNDVCIMTATGPVTPEVEEGLVEEVVTDESSSAEEAPTTDVNPLVADLLIDRSYGLYLL